MNPNLKPGSTFKELLLKKLSYAVTCSVLSHIAVVFIYIFVVNFNFHIAEWLKDTFYTLTSLSTWLYLVPFSSIIFAQIMICAKDYVLRTTYQLTRFRKIVSMFSVRTFILGFLHVLVGGLVIWLYLSLTGGSYQSLYVKCKGEEYCLVEGTFFMIVSGLWTGLYFFIGLYITDRNLVFPVIQQHKLQHFKSKFVPLLKESKQKALYPTLCYFVLYYIFGPYLRNSFAHIFKLYVQDESSSLWLYVYTWIFSILYILNMNLMRFFFELFLTEPVEHPVMAMYDNASLQEALLLNNIPILQNLACLDLYRLSIWSPQRRQALFTLSQPGGHPHTWNRLVEGALKLMTDFTTTLNHSTDALLNKVEKPAIQTRTPSIKPWEGPRKQSYVRNVTISSITEPIDVINISQTTRSEMAGFPNVISNTVLHKIGAALNTAKNIRTVKYVFGELPEAHIQQCLKNGQLIVWITQGLANVVIASFTEDPYGIVQKDLPVMITALVQLKQSVDKLNKVPAFSRKGSTFDDFSFKMKNTVHNAVRRSLCNICRTFGKYLNDIPLKKDIVMQLQCYL